MQRPMCKLVDADSIDPDNLKPGQVLLRTEEDAREVLMSIAADMCGGDLPTSLEGMAEVLFIAMSAASATLLTAAAQSANDGKDTHACAGSAAHSVRLMAKAAAGMVTTGAVHLMASKKSEFSSN